MSATFLVLYRGPTIPQAKLVAVSSDPALVAEFAERLLHDQPPAASPDMALLAIERGRRRALRLIVHEAEGGADGG